MKGGSPTVDVAVDPTNNASQTPSTPRPLPPGPPTSSMPRILAIDWDRREVRGLLVSSGATGTSVAGAWAASLTTTDPNGLSGKQIGARLAAAMSGQVTGKVTTLVAVSRDNVQMQLLSLPPAPADELPEMVRFQAERDFTTLGSEAVLDYIPIAGDAQTPHQVLAVALNATGVNEARELCESLGTEPNRIPLRAIAPASLVYRAGLIDAEHIALIVNPLVDEADLTVQAGDKVVLMRTVRLPDLSHPESRQRALMGEIRRTMTAVRQQLADRKVEQVIICGDASGFEASNAMSDDLEVPVTAFDVVTQAPSGLTSQGVPADGLARFAAVLGMALNEADRRAPIVDFANIRRKAERRPFGRVHVLAATAAVIGLLWLGAAAWRQLADKSDQLAEIEAEIASLETQVETFEEKTVDAAAIEDWLATDVNWLDEIEQFARRVRPQPLDDKNYKVDSDIVITQVTMTRPPGNNAVGGQLDLQAKAKSDAAVRDLEQRLRDTEHRVMPGSLQKDNSVPGYPRSLDLQVRITPSDADEAPKDEAPKDEAPKDEAPKEEAPKEEPAATESVDEAPAAKVPPPADAAANAAAEPQANEVDAKSVEDIKKAAENSPPAEEKAKSEGTP
jgi:hypothetical protein